MQELQRKLDGLLQIQADYCNVARNDESLNDKIRVLQKEISEFKTK